MKKENKLQQDWLAFNKQYKSQPKLRMTFQEYSDWVYGKTSKPKTTNKEFTFGRPSWAPKDTIPSVIGNSKCSLSKNSIVEKVTRGQIVGIDAEQIMSKSKRIGIAYSKGSYQYITEETDIKTIGKKSQQL